MGCRPLRLERRQELLLQLGLVPGLRPELQQGQQQRHWHLRVLLHLRQEQLLGLQRVRQVQRQVQQRLERHLACRLIAA